MNRIQQIQYLIQVLLQEMPAYREQARALPQGGLPQWRLPRSLMSVYPLMPLDPSFLAVQDALLSTERGEEGVVETDALPERPGHPGIALWQGDITRPKADAVVNADSGRLLGCFVPRHSCIDNAAHSTAGLQLRDGCSRLMEQQGCPEPAGQAKLTGGYNLLARYVLHTAGPTIHGRATPQDQKLLVFYYHSCLRLTPGHELRSMVFCCISIGKFHFPNQEAAQVAVQTVKEFPQAPMTVRKVTFNVLKDIDASIYDDLL